MAGKGSGLYFVVCGYKVKACPFLLLSLSFDIEDVRTVLLKNPQVDVAYIRRWLRELEKALNEPLAARFEELRKDSI